MFRPIGLGASAGLAAAGLAALILTAPSAAQAAPAAPGYAPHLTAPVETVAARKKVRKRPVVRYYRNGAPIAAAIGALAIGAAAAAASGAFVDDDYYYRPYPRRVYRDYGPYYGAPVYGGPVYGAPAYGYRQRYYRPRYAAPPAYRPPVAAPRYAPGVGRPATLPYQGPGSTGGSPPPFVQHGPGQAAGN